jgi:hypothetical protein
MFDLIPAGIYRAVAVATEIEGVPTFVQFGTTKGKDGAPGKKQVLMQFEILDGQHAGRRVPWWGYFTEKSWTNTVKGLRACGFKGDELHTLPSQQLDQEVSITIGINEWDGKQNNRVEWVNPASSGIKLADPMSGNDLRQFSAFMKAKAATVATVEGKKADKSQKGASGSALSDGHQDSPPPGDEDDIGF